LRCRRRRILDLLVTGLAAALLAGCEGENPAEPTTTTIIEGYGAELAADAGNEDTFVFSRGGAVYGEITLTVHWQEGPPEILGGYLSSYGIQVAEPGLLVAPEGGYSPQVSLGDPGSSYVLMTDESPHYARVDIEAVEENLADRRIAVTFDWVLQTQSGNRELH
jgi:hypothetical protein